MVISNRVYHLQERELHSFEKLDMAKPKKQITLNPTEQQIAYARELYDLATMYAELDGRTAPSSTQFKHGHADVIGDLEMARLVLAGEASAISSNDWWSIDLMA